VSGSSAALRAAFVALTAPGQPPARDRRYGRTPRPHQLNGNDYWAQLSATTGKNST